MTPCGLLTELEAAKEERLEPPAHRSGDEVLEYSHNLMLVAASAAVSVMASFTGLSLTRGINDLPYPQRKLMVAMASFALGGGIWSMHFVAMLGLTLPILFYYDALITLISALVAILIVGIALLIMHFRPRTPATITLAGVVVGIGIPAMHYIGMSGIQLCRAVYTPGGLAAAWSASVALGIASFWIVYGNRNSRNIILGTLSLGFAVFAVHFIAMGGTGFVVANATTASRPLLDNATLAMVVTVAAFVICGAFLLTGVTFLPGEERRFAGAAGGGATLGLPGAFAAAGPVDIPAGTFARVTEPGPPQPAAAFATPPVASGATRVPYEKDGRTVFVERSDIAAVRAEGHYTILYVGGQKLFCPWSISEATARLPEPDFVRAHRSYLINVGHVTGFERQKDNGVCFFEATDSLGKVPVSRSRLTAVREALGLH